MTNKPTLVYDIEVYRNYFLVSFMDVDTGVVRHFDKWPTKGDGADQSFDAAAIRKILATCRLVSFNGRKFDQPLLTRALHGDDCITLKWWCDLIINHNFQPWELDFPIDQFDHIDLIEVAPGFASLKIYGGRLHSLRMQDLPIEPSERIYPEQRELLRNYCANDLQTTLDLFTHLKPQIELRERMSAEYGIDLRSKSDAQIAEAVIRSKVEKITGRYLSPPPDRSGETFQYKPPAFVSFKRKPLCDVLETVVGATFTVSEKGVVTMPDEIASLSIDIGSSKYRMGIGGLHSSEKSVAHYADENMILEDRDVVSYYPAIILNCGLVPENMGSAFTTIYKKIVQERIDSKSKMAEISERMKVIRAELARLKNDK